MPLIFGFDIGTTSIGWAVINYDKDRQIGEIARKAGVPGLGVRIFPEARDPDGTPLNQQRRQKRMMRRQLRRRKVRRCALNEALADAGLLPPFSKDKNSEWATVMALDPYPLRAKGVAEPLPANELGRAIYHLSKRRHFKGRDLEDEDLVEDSNPKDSETSETPPPKARKGRALTAAAEKNENGDDEKKLKEEILTTHNLLKARGVTLGQWLSEKKSDARKGIPPKEKRREVHAHRTDVEAEFEALWTAQAPHHKALNDANLKARIKDTIFNQKPVFWRKATLGKCRFIPAEELCPRGSWLSQQRRMLEKLNNLAIVGGNARPLYPEERLAILEKLQTQGSMSWSKVRDTLKPIFKERGEAGAEKSIRFNLELDEGGTLLGNPLESKLADIFGATWENHPHKQAIRDAVHGRLWNADYKPVGTHKDKPTQRVEIRSSLERRAERAKAAQFFIDAFGATQEQAAKLRDLKLPTGWEPFSAAALQKFLPELEKGERFGSLTNSTETKYEDWREENFPDREKPTGELFDILPSPSRKSAHGREEEKRIATLRNPTVVRTQNELRKVVNNLIRVYGKPELIRVELARDVGKSKREREEGLKRNRKNERERKKAADDLKSKGIAEPSPRDIRKWVLWKECGEFDFYSGQPIDFDGLFRTNEFEIEHIWPESKSLDSSLGNLTLCHRDWNHRKHNRTPYKAFESDPAWEQMKKRVWDRVAAKALSKGKAKRFCWEGDLTDDFVSRQLNDTGYAARQAITFLKRLWPDVGPIAPVNVQSVTGKVTAQLRRFWELNNILSDDGEKTRADHRHHAIDALVVACAHPGVTNMLSRYLQQKDNPHFERPKLPPPWPNIRADAEKAITDIVISHRVRKKVSGPMHKESAYRDGKNDIKKGSITYREIVQRTPVNTLTQKDIDADDLLESKFVIRDVGARRALREQIERHDGDLKKALSIPIQIGNNAPSLMRSVRVSSKRQISGLAVLDHGIYDPEAKHHLPIYADPQDSEIVSMLEAARRQARGESVIARTGKSGSRLLFSLSKGDCVILNDLRAPYWVVRELKSNGQITLVPHTEARPTKQALNFKPTVSGLIKLKPRKVSIDPIGRVRPARD